MKMKTHIFNFLVFIFVLGNISKRQNIFALKITNNIKLVKLTDNIDSNYKNRTEIFLKNTLNKIILIDSLNENSIKISKDLNNTNKNVIKNSEKINYLLYHEKLEKEKNEVQNYIQRELIKLINYEKKLKNSKDYTQREFQSEVNQETKKFNLEKIDKQNIGNYHVGVSFSTFLSLIIISFGFFASFMIISLSFLIGER